MANPVARRAVRQAQKMNATPRVLKALIEAGIVESGLQHDKYLKVGSGDRDSTGFLQQRGSQGWGTSESIEKDTRDFVERAMRANRGFKGSAGQLAQAVQRSAYPGRYDERGAEAESILKRLGVGGSSSGASPAATERVTEKTPGVDNSDQRRALKMAYLSQRGKPTALLELASGLSQAQDVPATTKTTSKASAVAARDAPADSNLAKVIEEADKIDKAKVPYLWGGGHGARQERGSKVTPLDCSGAVSRALGLDPRVSGQFTKWGRPGRAPGGRGVTVYANSGHVLMEVNGRFWGTSQSNPGGGPGWIPRSQITPQYLSRFTARHSANLQ